MGRPQKQTVDYFPHFVSGSRKTVFVLEEAWRNDGYAFWFKLLEILCQNDGHYYDVSSSANLRYLYAYAKVTPELATEILDTLAELGNIDAKLWKERKIIWCQSLVDNLKGLYDKRTTPIPTKPIFEDNLPENPPEKEVSDTETPPTEKPRKPKRKPKTEKKEEPPKIQYADNVRLTEAEYNKLVETYGIENTQKLIEKLDNAKGAKGYTYQSDYRAILNWVVKDVIEKNGGVTEHGRNTNTATKNAPTNPGGFKPSGGFKKQ